MLLPKLGIRFPLPLFLLIHITLRCNRNCYWCYQKNDDFCSRNSGDMPMADFEKIIGSFKDSFFIKPHIHLFGGEPLLHNEFEEILQACARYNISPTLTTNGDYLEERVDLIRKSTISQLNISVNANSNGLADEGYSTLISAIKFLKNKTRKVINLNFALNPDDYHKLEDTALFLNSNFSKREINTFTCQHFMFNGKGIDAEKMNSDIIVEQVKGLKKAKLNFKLLFLPSIALEDIDKYYRSRHAFKHECFVPWAGLSIYPDLTVTMGGGVLWCNKIVGDLRFNSIREIWRGAKLSEFRLDLLRQGLPGQCGRCCQKLYY